MKTVTLEVPKDIKNLTGYPLGKNLYSEQISKIYVAGEELCIKFPDNIEKVGISFVQGFFSEIKPLIGYEGIIKTITIDTIHPKLREQIFNKITV